MKTLSELKKLIKNQNLDAYIVSKNDEFFGEYAFPNRLKTISNFSGSAGFAVITLNLNYLFVDGRYTIQAQLQSGKLFKIIEIHKLLPRHILKNLKLHLDFLVDILHHISLLRLLPPLM